MIRSFVAGLALALIGPAALHAQDDDAPPQVLSVSSYVCPQSSISDIAENYDTYTRPVEDELVTEGMLLGAGLFFHAWADEYNVNYYRVAPSMAGLFEAVAEVGRRVTEQNPELADGPGPFAVCTAHKDNIYFMGPSTEAEPPEGM